MRDNSRGRPLGRAAFVGTCVTLLAWTSLAGCSASSADLKKIARGVPIPPGVTLVRTDAFTNGGIGGSKQVNVVYAEPAVGCDQMRSAWIAALRKAHRKYSLVGTGQVRFVLPSSTADLSITLDWDGTGECTQAAVIAEAK